MGRYVSGDAAGGAGGPFTEAAPFTASGTWDHPEPGVLYEVIAEAIGGGGGGASGCARHEPTQLLTVDTYGGRAGVAGARHYIRTFTRQSEQVIVGAGGVGGAAVVRTGTGSGRTPGNSGTAGGSSSFGRFVGYGGAYGTAPDTPTTAAAELLPSANTGVAGIATHNAEPSVAGTNGTNATSSNSKICWGGQGTRTHFGTTATNGGNAVLTTNMNATAGAGGSPTATDYGAPGAGGGTACSEMATVSQTHTSGAGGSGAPGIVRVWLRKA